jgi:hypothetical protein
MVHKKILIKEYFKIVVNRLKFLEDKIDLETIEKMSSEIKENRNKITENFFDTTFGVFFAILTWRTIENCLDYKFPNNLMSVIILFLIWGIFFIILKLYLLSLDRNISKNEKLKKITKEELTKLGTLQDNNEKELFD